MTRVATLERAESARPDWLAPRFAWTMKSVFEGIFVGVLVSVGSIVFRTEIIASDPVGYMNAARNFPSDTWAPLGYTRYGMILPRLPLIWVFGNSTVTHYFWPIVSSGALAASMYLIVYRFWGRLFGALAILLTLCSSITFINLSRGYPDIQSIAIVSLAVALSLAIRDRSHSESRVPRWLWFCVGFLLGWGFETRETTILVWPVIAVIVWTRSLRARGLIFCAAGLGLWAATDILIGAVAYGDPLIRLHAMLGQDLSTGAMPADQVAKAQFVGQSRAFYFLFIPKAILASGASGVVAAMVGLLGLLGLCFRGGARLISGWYALSFLTFAGITGGFLPDHPSGRVDIVRYWICFLPVGAAAAAGTTAEIARLIGRHLQRPLPRTTLRLTQRGVDVLLATLVAIGPSISVIGYAASEPQLAINGGDQLSQLRAYLADQNPQGKRLLTDLATARVLPVYQRGNFGGDDVWSTRIVDIGTVKEPKPGDLVAVNSLDNESCFFCHDWITKWYAEKGPIPDNWELLWASRRDNLVLYRVP